ncbi:hypothetical protein RvY_09738 [Ramazzottius varieornatus]|uniref:RING-type domain-containing protein n=1 Tax=Ramazzottius varieornatus TaxID=947166 RepID=A0A1D1VAF0_RAMVA|nr:hypothetical protein RvY_09738 [Ramazzottius varieornatus]
MPSPSLLTPTQYHGLDAMASMSNEYDRALQLALELSRFNLQSNNDMTNGSSLLLSGLRYPGPSSPTSAAALSLKRSQNTTECVVVPTSEHVAEIVGKQGCKIKALRTKTNTYVKTPVRGEEPVFVITGRSEDVEIAKAEIMQAAEHFTQIRAQRRLQPPPHVPGQITIQLPVPLRLVGLIVGPKGQTIKKVQQDTGTYIITPGRDKDPIFEITGCQEGVERARELIEDHVLARTGSTVEELISQQNDPNRQRSSSLDDGIRGMDIWRDSERSSGSSMEDFGGGFGKADMANFDIGCWNVTRESPTPDSQSSNGGGSQFFSQPKVQRSFSLMNSSGASEISVYMDNRRAQRLNSDPMPVFGSSIWNMGGAFDNEPGNNSSFGGSYFASNFTNSFADIFGKSINSTGDSVGSSSPAESVVSQKAKRDCAVCQEQEVVAALVPCGHNHFCMPCARTQQACPVCGEPVQTAIRIQMD